MPKLHQHVIGLDKERHQWTVDGVPKPGITGVLRRAGAMDEIAMLPESGRTRGQIAHEWLEIANKGQLHLYEPDQVALTIIRQWERTLITMGATIAVDDEGPIAERYLYSPDADVCTAVDTVIDWPTGGGLWGVNIKSGGKWSYYKLQLAAELRILRDHGIPVIGMAAMYLNGSDKLGQWRPLEGEDDAMAVFDLCLIESHSERRREQIKNFLEAK